MPYFSVTDHLVASPIAVLYRQGFARTLGRVNPVLGLWEHGAKIAFLSGWLLISVVGPEDLVHAANGGD